MYKDKQTHTFDMVTATVVAITIIIVIGAAAMTFTRCGKTVPVPVPSQQSQLKPALNVQPRFACTVQPLDAGYVSVYVITVTDTTTSVTTSYFVTNYGVEFMPNSTLWQK